ncbi:MAG: hypothetical protein KA175_03390 [Flavobacteriales bacterium]|nr:hypothetical protein [Flavobacteriales bacterium]MBP6696637.1 hypothetical protein [Flavobacteriales bacterium]
MRALFLAVCFSPIIGCAEHYEKSVGATDNVAKDSNRCDVDTTDFSVLRYEHWLGLKDVMEDTIHPLTLRDFEEAECLLLETVQLWNSDSTQHYRSDDSIDLTRYHRQYCPLTNKEDHRLVYLNAVCSRGGQQEPVEPKTAHQKGWIFVLDGGHCYFQALFDLTTGRVLSFTVNGEA